jgi:peptide/nickel transport system substrate-binding protein
VLRLRKTISWLVVVVCFLAASAQKPDQQDFFHTTSETGIRGGRLVIGLRSEPKTLNPVTATDLFSRDVIRRMMADLIHINRYTQKTEPSLAKSWTASPDGKQFTLQLRHGIRFSDGAPFDADDVLFSFKVYLDEKLHSPQRDLLIVSGVPVVVEKLGPYTVRFTFPSSYSVGDRFFDSLAILPRHLLEKDYADGKIAETWNLNTPPEKIVGLGPFRLKKFIAGDRVILERNPYYWKVDSKGQQLPYLDELTFLAVPNSEAEVVRFKAGDTQVISGLNGENFAALLKDEKAAHYKLADAGPSLEYNFVLLNQNTDVQGKNPVVAAKQKWFNDVRFRHAISYAVDRDSIVRLVYRGRGMPLITHVTAGTKLWVNEKIPVPKQSISLSKQYLQSAGFSWKPDGALVDASGHPVEFTLLVSSSNAARNQMATLVQDDLKQVGMKVSVVPMDFRAVIDRLQQSHDYEATLLGFGGGDADPNSSINVLMSNGDSHLWNLGQKKPATPWEAEIDQLMEKQLSTRDYHQRKKMYDRVQEILAEQQPFICLASPDVLVGAREGLGNFQPAVLEHYTLWNVEELFWRTSGQH